MDFSVQRRIDDAAAASEDYDKRVGTPLSATALSPTGTPGEYAREATALTTSASVLAPGALILKRAKDDTALDELRKLATTRLGSYEELQLLELPKMAPQVLAGRVASKSTIGTGGLSLGGQEHAWLAGKVRENARTGPVDSSMLVPDGVLVGALEGVADRTGQSGDTVFKEYFVSRYVAFSREDLSVAGRSAYSVSDDSNLSDAQVVDAKAMFDEISLDCPKLFPKVRSLVSSAPAASMMTAGPTEHELKFISRELSKWALTKSIDRNVLGYAVSLASAASAAGDELRAISVACGHGSGILDRCSSVSAATVTSDDVDAEELVAMLAAIPKNAMTALKLRAFATLSEPVDLDQLKALLNIREADYARAGIRLALDGAPVCLETQGTTMQRLINTYRAAREQEIDRADAEVDDGRSVALEQGDIIEELRQHLASRPVTLTATERSEHSVGYNLEYAGSFIRSIAHTLTGRVGEQMAVGSAFPVVSAVVRLLSATNAALLTFVHTDVSDLLASELASKRRPPLSYEYVLLARLSMIAYWIVDKAASRARALGFYGEEALAEWLASNHGRNSFDGLSALATADSAASSRFSLRRPHGKSGETKPPIFASDRQFELVCRYAYVARKTLPGADAKMESSFAAAFKSALGEMHVKSEWVGKLSDALDRLFAAGEAAMSGIEGRLSGAAGSGSGSPFGGSSGSGGGAPSVVLDPGDPGYGSAVGFMSLNEFLSARRAASGLTSTFADVEGSVREYAAWLLENEMSREVRKVGTIIGEGKNKGFLTELSKAAQTLKTTADLGTAASVHQRLLHMYKLFMADARSKTLISTDSALMIAPLSPAEEGNVRNGLPKPAPKGTVQPLAVRDGEVRVASDLFLRRLATVRSHENLGATPEEKARSLVEGMVDELSASYSVSGVLKSPAKPPAKSAKTKPAASKYVPTGDEDYSSDDDDEGDASAAGAGKTRKEEAAVAKRNAEEARASGSEADGDSIDFAESFAISADFGRSLLTAGLSTLEILAWFSLAANTALQQGSRYGATAQVSGMATRMATLVHGLSFASTEIQIVYAPARLDLCPSLEVIGPSTDNALRAAFARGSAMLLRRGRNILAHRTDNIHSSLHTLGGGLAWYANTLLNVFPGRYHEGAAATNQDEAFYVGYICARGSSLPELYEMCLDIVLTGSGAVHTARIFSKLPAVASVLGHAYSAARVLSIMAADVKDTAMRENLTRESSRLQDEFKRAYSQRFKYGGAAGYISGERTDIEGLKVALKGPIARAIACLMATRDKNLEDLRKAPSATRFLRSNALEAMEVSALSSYYWATYKTRVHRKAIDTLTAVVAGGTLAIEDG